MYVILTSKPGQFRTEAVAGLRPLQAYDYRFYGHTKAHFVIAELLEESTKIRVIEDGTAIINDVPSKFLEKFETTALALKELEHLTTFGHMQTELCRMPLPASKHASAAS
ncbi:MAG: ferredoxin [Rhizobiales bacterium]|nr:ferredoxin [Hyphomicrobiales bacterium]